jgi:hypothetical protein
MAVLVIASLTAFEAHGVNFESGGGWISGKKVIPCCANGIQRSDLPAPLGHLQALELAAPIGLRKLVEFLAFEAKLNPPSLDYDELATRFGALAATDREPTASQ